MRRGKAGGLVLIALALAAASIARQARAEETWDALRPSFLFRADLVMALEGARGDVEGCLAGTSVPAVTIAVRITRRGALRLVIRTRAPAPEVRACVDTVVRQHVTGLLTRRIHRRVEATVRVRRPVPATATDVEDEASPGFYLAAEHRPLGAQVPSQFGT